MPVLTKKETATVLAALRYWQHNVDIKDIPYRFRVHFDEVKPLRPDQIDGLCEKIAFG